MANKMKTIKIEEHGYNSALLGISLSRNQPLENMPKVAYNLSDKGGGHSKFLESICVWLDITAPRYLWQQISTYRIGTSTQSESTMYTIMKREIVQEDFEEPINQTVLDTLNQLIRNKEFDAVKNCLPEGYLQRRIICTNYKTLQNMIWQRRHHKLDLWKQFCKSVLEQLDHPEFIVRENTC